VRRGDIAKEMGITETGLPKPRQGVSRGFLKQKEARERGGDNRDARG